MANNQTCGIQTKHPSGPDMINDEINTKTNNLQSSINNHDMEDHKKTTDQIPTVNSNSDQAIVPPLNDTSDSTQSDNTASVEPTKTHHHQKSSRKTNSKSHKHAVQDHSINEDNDGNTKQRSLSSSSSTSSSSSKSSDNQTSNIPYETLHNEEDDDDLPEHTEKPTDQTSL